MKLSALVFTPLVLASFIPPRNLNRNKAISDSASAFRNNKLSFVDTVKRERVKQFYSDEIGSGDGTYNYTHFVQKPEKYTADEIFFNFQRHDLKATLNMYKDGANPDLKFKDEDTMAHLIAYKPLGPDQKREDVNDSIEIIRQLGKSGHDFSIKNSKGQTSVDVARERGNDELATLIEKLDAQQMKLPRKFSDINDRLHSIAAQRNPSVKARKIAANLLKAGANIDEGVPGSKNTIMDEAISNWNKASSDTFQKLAENAKNNALKSTENIVYLGQNTSNKELIDEMTSSWEKDTKYFSDLGKPQSIGRGL